MKSLILTVMSISKAFFGFALQGRMSDASIPKRTIVYFEDSIKEGIL